LSSQQVDGTATPSEHLIDAHASVSPLFLRFAIEQALMGELGSTRTLDLVLQYVEALRAGKLDINADDMLRAASIAATEAVRESLVPGEIEPRISSPVERWSGVAVAVADLFVSPKNRGPDYWALVMSRAILVSERFPAMPHTLRIDGGSESQKTYPLVNQTESAMKIALRNWRRAARPRHFHP
jgi:hypothetical protein